LGKGWEKRRTFARRAGAFSDSGVGVAGSPGCSRLVDPNAITRLLLAIAPRIRLYCFRRFIRASFQSLRRLTGGRPSEAIERPPPLPPPRHPVLTARKRATLRARRPSFVAAELVARDTCLRKSKRRARGTFPAAKLSSDVTPRGRREAGESDFPRRAPAERRRADETLSSDGPPNGDLIPGCSLVPAIFTV